MADVCDLQRVEDDHHRRIPLSECAHRSPSVERWHGSQPADTNEAGAKETAKKISTETGNPAYGFTCDVADRPQLLEAWQQATDAIGGLVSRN
jgi:hypothetical protein